MLLRQSTRLAAISFFKVNHLYPRALDGRDNKQFSQLNFIFVQSSAYFVKHVGDALEWFNSRKLKDGLKRQFSEKRESYFAAIGGESDEPPPELTKEHVTKILSSNQATMVNCLNNVSLIECNQLASNYPIEDRMRISRLNYESLNVVNASSGDQPTASKNKPVPDSKLRSLLCGVFDGHGGEMCADLISDRLYSYLAIAILNCVNPNERPEELVNASYLQGLSLEKFNKLKSKIIEDLYVKPQLMNPKSSIYDEEHWSVIRDQVRREEQAHLVRFAKKLAKNPVKSIPEAIKVSFKQCDSDLSEEIERNLQDKKSRLLSHYYFSLAASGSCASLIYITDDHIYVASSGDCRAIMSSHDGNVETSKLITLGTEHDADNINEIKRVMDAHPPNERNFILKNHRLLGQLMPLRAFGDFCYKWSVEKIQQTGLTRAFGPHIIPPNYFTPPYLIVEPEVIEYPLSETDKSQKFLVLATDGLWEQFANVRQVMKTIIRHQTKFSDIQKNGPLANVSLNFDYNSATYLLRNALGQTYLRNFDAHIETEEILRQQHERLASFLSLPQSVVRNFRDDISVIVIYLK